MSCIFTEIRSPGNYIRRSPALHNFSPLDKEFEAYARQQIGLREVHYPAEGFFSFSNAIVWESKHVLLDDAEFLQDSIDDFLATDTVQSVVQARSADVGIDPLPPSSRLDVFFAKAGASNYGHFLTDCLTKLINLAEANLGPVRLHIPAEASKFQELVEAICSHFSLDVELYLSNTGEANFVERGIYLSSTVKHNTRKSGTIRALRNALFDYYGVTPSFSESNKIFVARSQSEIRKISNAEQIYEMFRSRGFRILYPGELSFGEQMHLFSDASAVAGPLGAGLTNLMFTNEATTSLMIDPGLTDYYFWDLAAQFSGTFNWHFAHPPQRYSTALELSDFEVDADRLDQVLSAIVF